MPPDDPIRLPLLIAGLLVMFGGVLFGAPIAAWGLRWKRRAEMCEGRLREVTDREAMELSRGRLLELQVHTMRRNLARALGLLRR